MKTGINLIAEERARHSGQRYNHTEDSDAALADHELAGKAVKAINEADPLGDPQAYGRALVKAGSLIAAELDRLVRKHGGISIPAYYGDVTEPTNDGKPSRQPVDPPNDGNPGPGAGPTNDAPPEGEPTTTEAEAEAEEEVEEETEEEQKAGTETAKQLEENNTHEDLVQLAADEEVEVSARENKGTIAKAIVKARKKKAKANQ